MRMGANRSVALKFRKDAGNGLEFLGCAIPCQHLCGSMSIWKSFQNNEYASASHCYPGNIC